MRRARSAGASPHSARTNETTVTAAFKSALEAAIGPVDQLHARTDEEVRLIGFTQGGSLLISVAPYAAGWAVLIEGGRSEPEVISYAATPTEAMQRAECSDASL
jgi:hypothetical protein